MDKKEKEIPTRNYAVVIIGTIVVIALALYIRNIYLNYEANKYKTSIFSSQLISQINEKDFDFALPETTEALLLVSYTGERDVYSAEKKLYKKLEDKNLLDKLIYFDVTSSLKKDEYINVLKTRFPNIKKEIKKAPMIIYIEDAEAKDVIKANDFKALDNLLEKYEIE